MGEVEALLERLDALSPDELDEAAALGRARSASSQGAERAAALALAGLCALRRFDDAAGQRDLLAALELAREALDEALEARILYRLPYSVYRVGAFERAFGLALQALELARARGDARGEGKALHDIGASYHALGEYHEALAHLLGSLECFEVIGHPDAAIAYNGIGLCYRALGHDEQALEAFGRSLALRQGAPYGEGVARINLALAHKQRGDLAAAIHEAEASLTRFEAVNDPIMTAYARNELAALWLSTGEAARARDLYAHNLGDPRVVDTDVHLATLRGLGCLALEAGDAEEALAHFLVALERGERHDLKKVLVEVHFDLSRCYEHLGQLEKALAHYRRFHQLQEALVGERTQQRLGMLMIRFETEQARKDREIYRLQNIELARAYEQLSELHRQLRQQADTLEHLSIRDPLTGLHNRRFLDEQLGRLVGAGPLSVAVADIDDFKEINDRFGHALGDEVLRRIAAIFREELRGGDVVVRYGGEEFVLVLPETHEAAARQVCERVRRRVEGHPWGALEPQLAVTLSIGLASAEGELAPDGLLRAADEKLYEVKRSGKNRVSL